MFLDSLPMPNFVPALHLYSSMFTDIYLLLIDISYSYQTSYATFVCHSCMPLLYATFVCLFCMPLLYASMFTDTYLLLMDISYSYQTSFAAEHIVCFALVEF